MFEQRKILPCDHGCHQFSASPKALTVYRIMCESSITKIGQYVFQTSNKKYTHPLTGKGYFETPWHWLFYITFHMLASNRRFCDHHMRDRMLNHIREEYPTCRTILIVTTTLSWSILSHRHDSSTLSPQNQARWAGEGAQGIKKPNMLYLSLGDILSSLIHLPPLERNHVCRNARCCAGGRSSHLRNTTCGS